MVLLLLRWLISIILLPGTVLVAIPLALAYVSPILRVPLQAASFGSLPFWTSMVPALMSVILSTWTMALFLRWGGDGTPAPWDPPSQLVIRGPYRYVRNPMILGVILMLIALGTYLGSLLILGWALTFLLLNNLYFSRIEEPQLLRRFGAPYAAYCRAVRRWVPRISPWRSA